MHILLTLVMMRNRNPARVRIPQSVLGRDEELVLLQRYTRKKCVGLGHI